MSKQISLIPNLTPLYSVSLAFLTHQLYVCMYVCMHVLLCVYVCMCVCMCVCVCVCMYVIYVMCMCVCMCVCMYVIYVMCMCVCMCTGDLERSMRQLYEVSDSTECRVWHRYLTNSYELLSNSAQSLQDAGLYSGQVGVASESVVMGVTSEGVCDGCCQLGCFHGCGQ